MKKKTIKFQKISKNRIDLRKIGKYFSICVNIKRNSLVLRKTIKMEKIIGKMESKSRRKYC